MNQKLSINDLLAVTVAVFAAFLMTGFFYLIHQPLFLLPVWFLYVLGSLGLLLCYESVKFLGNSNRRACWMLALGIFCLLLAWLLLEALCLLSL